MSVTAEVQYQELKQKFERHISELRGIKAELDSIEQQAIQRQRIKDDDRKVAEILATISSNESGSTGQTSN